MVVFFTNASVNAQWRISFWADLFICSQYQHTFHHFFFLIAVTIIDILTGNNHVKFIDLYISNNQNCFLILKEKRNKLESSRRHAHGTCRKTTPHAQSATVADPGEGSGRPGPLSVMFRPNGGPKGRKNVSWKPRPRLPKGLDENNNYNNNWQNRLAPPKHIGVFDVFLRFWIFLKKANVASH